MRVSHLYLLIGLLASLERHSQSDTLQPVSRKSMVLGVDEMILGDADRIDNTDESPGKVDTRGDDEGNTQVPPAHLHQLPRS